MPWAVKKSPKAKGKKFAIVKKDSGKVVGHSATKQDAEASVRARYASMKGKEHA